MNRDLAIGLPGRLHTAQNEFYAGGDQVMALADGSWPRGGSCPLQPYRRRCWLWAGRHWR